MALVFVYGSLRQGMGNHRFLAHERFVGRGEVPGRLLDLGPFPGMVAGDGRVVGEVYEVSEAAFAALDVLEGHPRLYRRRPRRVALDAGRVTRAWVYEFQQAWAEETEEVDGAWLEVPAAPTGRVDWAQYLRGVRR